MTRNDRQAASRNRDTSRRRRGVKKTRPTLRRTVGFRIAAHWPAQMPAVGPSTVAGHSLPSRSSCPIHVRRQLPSPLARVRRITQRIASRCISRFDSTGERFGAEEVSERESEEHLARLCST